MIVSGLNENESQEREQGGIMWREIEFHLYRVHLLTLRFLGGNGAERFPPPLSRSALGCVPLFPLFSPRSLLLSVLSLPPCSYPRPFVPFPGGLNAAL